MAIPVISAIADPLNFTINTPINFPIPISNNPFPIRLRGDVEEIYYSWDGERLYLRGTITQTLENRRITIYATDAEDATNIVESEFVYNVRNAAPIITEIPAVRIVRGVEQSIFIPIANNPSEIAIEGLLVGLDHQRGRSGDQDGLEIIGRVPLDANFTTNTGRFWVSTENDGGADSWGDSDSGGLGWTLARASLPSAIRNLRASVSGTSVTLTWTAGADGGTPITGYEYQIDGGEWIRTGSTAASVVIQNLVARAADYSFRVRPLNGLGTGPASAAVRVNLTIPPVINAIANVSQTSGYGQFTIQASLESGTTPVTWSISGISGATISTTGLITIPAGLSVATHTATVTASNAAGSDTERFSVVVAAIPVAPVILSFGSGFTRSAGYAQFTIQSVLSAGTGPITWGISGIAGATISNRGLITIPAGLADGSHTATVTASNTVGSDAESFTLTIAGVRAPAGTITLSATVGNAQVALSWNHPSDRGFPVATYRVYRDSTLIATVSGTSYTATRLTNGAGYNFYVQAFNTQGAQASNTVVAYPRHPLAPVWTTTPPNNIPNYIRTQFNVVQYSEFQPFIGNAPTVRLDLDDLISGNNVTFRITSTAVDSSVTPATRLPFTATIASGNILTIVIDGVNRDISIPAADNNVYVYVTATNRYGSASAEFEVRAQL